MKPSFRTLIFPVFTFAACFLVSCGSNHLLKEMKVLDHYPSASAVEYQDGKIYVMGDDAGQLLILDSSFAIIDSVPFFTGTEKRIPKNIKPDLESATLLRDKSKTSLLLTGSGSFAPYRHSAYLVDLQTRKIDSVRLDSFYSTLSELGLKEINIEGACTLPFSLVLANRGNLGNPSNYLVFTQASAITRQRASGINLVRVGGNSDSTEFRGISGLCYAKRSDRLIMTVSTEATANAFDDGAIGKSYLWIIRNISSKRNWKAVNPDKVIDLEDVDPRFKGQKIESVCISSETRDFLHLILAADNDDGSSTLFKMVIEK